MVSSSDDRPSWCCVELLAELAELPLAVDLQLLHEAADLVETRVHGRQLGVDERPLAVELGSSEVVLGLQLGLVGGDELLEQHARVGLGPAGQEQHGGAQPEDGDGEDHEDDGHEPSMRRGCDSYLGWPLTCENAPQASPMAKKDPARVPT